MQVMYINFLICFGFLTVLSYLDIKSYRKEKGGIYSIILDIFILIMFIANMGNLLSLVLAGLIAMVFYDLSYIWGTADIKAYIATALSFTLINLVWFTLIMTVVVVGYQYFLKETKIVKKVHGAYPFIPAILIAYIVSFLIFSSIGGML